MNSLTRITNTLRSWFRSAYARAAPKLGRSEYKAQWNSVSETEEHAKTAVIGNADEEQFKTTAQQTVAVLERLVGVRSDDVILEIGAGVGRVGAFLAPRCREWIGTDASENMVGHIKRRLAKFSNVRAVATNGYDLREILSESVDLVYCTVVFMHLEEWDRYSYVKEGFRILKPGGRMFVDNVNLVSDEGWKFFESVRALSPSERPSQISTTSTPQELETYFSRAGFSEIQQESNSLWIWTVGKKPVVS